MIMQDCPQKFMLASLTSITDFDATPRDVFTSIPDLIKSRDADRRLMVIAGIKGAATKTLILRIGVTEDPLTLWDIHQELTLRNIPPCFRWPSNESSAQHEFVTWLADLAWIAQQRLYGKVTNRDWRPMVKASASEHPESWHRNAMVLHQRAIRMGLASYCSRVLDLSDEARKELMTLSTKRIAARRDTIKGASLEALKDMIRDHAEKHPDRSGTHTPEHVASRRVRMWRTYVLADMNRSRAAEIWCATTGEKISRQAFNKQLEIAETDAKMLPSSTCLFQRNRRGGATGNRH
jgi:hypothetical protein